MKTQFYPIASKLRNLIAFVLTLFIINRTCAQNVTISTDPVFWGQATVNGDLIIEGDFLTSLSGMGDGLFGDNLSTVTGDLIIRNCNGPLFTSLNGLQFLTSVGGDVIIENCNKLTDLKPLSNIQSIGDALSVGGNASISAFSQGSQ